MNLAEPRWLFLIWLVPVAILLVGWGYRNRRARLSRLAQNSTLKNLIPKDAPAKMALKGILLAAAVGLLALAVARPRWGFEWRDVKRRGVDIMIAVDVSRSMLAEDIKPNRLQRAKREIVDLIRMLKGDRVGLIAFAGVAFIQCPLTVDYNAVQMFLDHLNENLIQTQGTSLADAIQIAVASLKAVDSEESTGKALILITDGEDQGSEVMDAVAEAKAAGVKIFPIGVGAPGGAPIPEAGGGFKKDATGEVVLSRLGEGTLQKIASETGGDYVRSVTGDMDLERVYLEGIRGGMKLGELKASREKLWFERFQFFALAAFVALFGEMFIRPFRRR